MSVEDVDIDVVASIQKKWDGEHSYNMSNIVQVPLNSNWTVTVLKISESFHVFFKHFLLIVKRKALSYKYCALTNCPIGAPHGSKT